MIFTSNTKHVTQPEPLPAEFSPALVKLDERFAQHAARQIAPEGLSERVFEASVQLLPNRSVRRRRLQNAGSLVFPHLTRGRVAMAASVMLACTIAVWFLQSPAVPENSGVVVELDGSDELWASYQAVPFEAVSLDETFTHLLVTNNLTTSEDIKHALELEG